MDGFIAGFAYGTTSVLCGQPFDTLKTLVQVSDSSKSRGLSSFKVASDLFHKEGIRGLYRGGLPLVIGGACIRSTQFGVNDLILQHLSNNFGGTTTKEDRLFGLIDWKVVVAGFCGGVARGVVESPFEFLKVRRQMDSEWKLTQLWNGSGATILRNSFLFGSFVIYMDISKQFVQLSPFWLGSICANLAWITVWPLDVVKTQLQAGTHKDKSIGSVLASVFRSGALFRGLGPGLLRSTISNGFAMMAYKEVEARMKRYRELNE